MLRGHNDRSIGVTIWKRVVCRIERGVVFQTMGGERGGYDDDDTQQLITLIEAARPVKVHFTDQG